MRFFITVITVALVWLTVSSSPVDHQLKTAPAPHQRTLPRPHVKHSDRPVQNQGPPALSPLEYKVTKGTYICGDKICKMTPGVIPENCPRGMCQYPLGHQSFLPREYFENRI